MYSVAPSRVRGLKHRVGCGLLQGCSRTLTGAWIETFIGATNEPKPLVAPSRVRGLKLDAYRRLTEDPESHPHGCVD